VETNGHRHSVIARRGADGWLVSFDGRQLSADVTKIGGRWSLLLGPAEAAHHASPSGNGPHVGRAFSSYDVAVETLAGSERVVHVDGRSFRISLAAGRAGRAGRRDRHCHAATGPVRVASPMAGRIVKVLVSLGDVVEARQGLVVVEAMKMENELRAPRAGTVTDVRVVAGSAVDAGTVVCVIE
jgi:biotin carboxyl carrier protein